MTIQQAYQQLLLQLYEIYDDREAANIADLTIEKITGFRKIDRIINKNFPLNKEQEELYDYYAKELALNKPVQYIIGEAWFAGMKLHVNENVLIPRPETEELVEWIVQENAKVKSQKVKGGEEIKRTSKFSILDIGTGSGCISIALKKRLPTVEVSAIDVSAGALEVARRNALEQEALVHVYQLNFLDRNEWHKLETFDIIVSNPPYIKQSEEEAMHKNVLNFEPHLALFVPDEDALIFYKNIALFAEEQLKENGTIFLEINEALGNEVADLFKSFGYNSITIKKDMQGKDRMVRVAKA
jgi:release factor glutamine methyltransferase